jgi:feruloyl-CoA synthase
VLNIAIPYRIEKPDTTEDAMNQYPPSAAAPFLPPAARASRLPGGGIALESGHALASTSTTVFAWLRHWAATQPDAVFLAERDGPDWRRITYAEMFALTACIARRLLAAGCGPDRPLATIGPNSIDHAAVMLAAMRAGIPAAPISSSYATRTTDYTRLTNVLASLPPGAIYLATPAAIAPALETLHRQAPLFSIERHGKLVPSLADLSAADTAQLAVAEAAVTPATIAKILFTSGSTGTPKGVINSNLMLCTSQDAHATVWPFLNRQPPVLVDWLPWHHTFGGNFCFNMVLRNGGTLYIDSGSPLPAGIAATVENLRAIAPTIYFNVPAGYAALLDRLEKDEALATHFFSRLNFLFSSGAGLPPASAGRLQVLAHATTGRAIPILGAWGATETAPTSTILHFSAPDAANIGLPVPGTTIRLVPAQDRLELRVRGPNITPGYWREPALTQAAFDEDGFFKTGDAGKLADDSNPASGILYDGRLGENFKLLSGTWVDVNRVRLAAIAALHPLARDIVVCGHGTDSIALLIFPQFDYCRAALGNTEQFDDAQVAQHPRLAKIMAAALATHNQTASGASTRVRRFAILPTPPRPEHGEITDKGYINQRAVRDARAGTILDWVNTRDLAGA